MAGSATTPTPHSDDEGAAHSERVSKVSRLPWQTIAIGLLSVITLILVGWALQAMSSVVVPFIFSILIALVVAPVDSMVKRRMPRRFGWLGHVAAMGLIIVILFVFLGGIWLSAQRISDAFPQVSQKIEELAPMIASGSSGTAEGAQGASAGGGENAAGAAGSAGTSGSSDVYSSVTDQFRGAGGQLGSRIAEYASSYASSVLSSAGSALAAMVLIFFFTLLMLIEAPNWRAKVCAVVDPDQRSGVFESLDVIARQLRRYLLIRVVLGLLTAGLYAAWLWFFGVELLLVWAILAFLLNFVPTLGSLVAGALPVVHVYVQQDFRTAVIVGIGILVIEQIMGNYVDPRVQGKQLSVSPLVILLVLLVWGWVWGVAGALLAVPVTIGIIVTCAHLPRLRPVALFLSDETSMDDLDDIVSAK
ncbi:AI-2E family transporter [Aurantimonas coralicida]|uniref:AI-2E family transporter n=1 Tax=Aurantimonas coralicida TaxID=182270 RepID=UPI0023A20ED0|nr:AI-2E family transporter [Aurantimonas coralicida]MDE0923664.1 AI-2E family transporter [Aurantimonas coralicida]